MDETTTLSVLQQKVHAGLERQKARAMTAARALRISVAKAAEEELELALGVIGLTDATAESRQFVEDIGETDLMVLVDTPGRGGAAAVLDSMLVAAIVQQQTMGRVGEAQADAKERKGTRTDAALVASWLDRVFKKAEKMPDTDEDRQFLSGLRFGAHLAEKRLLSMALDAPEYRRFGLTLDIAAGIRQGRMELILPISDDQQTVQPSAEGNEVVPATLEASVLPLPAQLQIALCRMRFTFAEIAAMKPGDELSLPEGVVSKSEILTQGGRLVGHGTLGQIGGMRAIKIAPDASMGRTPQRRASDSPAGVPQLEMGGGMDAGAPPALGLLEPGGGSDGLPDIGGAGDAEGLPDLPGLDSPDMGGLGDLPSIEGADLPDLPSMGDDALPDLPDLPGAGDLPDLPPLDGGGLPDLPSMDGDGLPDLPDLPELPPLP